MFADDIYRHAPVLLVSVLRSPSTYLCTISGTGREDGVEIVDLTERMPGYGEAAGIEEIKAEIVQAGKSSSFTNCTRYGPAWSRDYRGFYVIREVDVRF